MERKRVVQECLKESERESESERLDFRSKLTVGQSVYYSVSR